VTLVAIPLAVVLASWRHPAGAVWAHLWETQLAELLANTILLAGGVGFGTLVLGTSLAWLVVGYEFPGRRLFEWALALPLAVPAYVIGFVFLGIFDFAGPLQSSLRAWLGEDARPPAVPAGVAVGIVMTLVFYPYVYLLARTAFREQGLATLEAARSLGRSRAQAFRKVVLPMARPSLAAGAALAMMEALADFGTVTTFGYRTLTEAIYRVWTGMFDRIAATQLASLLLVFSLGLLVLERALRHRRRFTQSQRRGPAAVPLKLSGVRAAGATLACTLVLALAFALPVGQLMLWAVAALRSTEPGRNFGHLLWSSFVLAGSAAAIICTVALTVAYAARLHPSRVAQHAGQFASMGYALPGAVIAVGVLGPVAWLDRALSHGVSWLLDRPIDLVLTGSALAVLFAYLVRFLAVGFQTVDASLAKIPTSLDEASHSLGVGTTATLRRVHLPLLRPGVLTAFILAWVETMKELPATLLLRPLGLKTLAIEVWERTSESLWIEAALPALAIVLVGLVPLYLSARLGPGVLR
jgi:iron(III) transport system permease protein